MKKIESFALLYLLHYCDSYDNIKGHIQDITSNGCASGVTYRLLTNKDTHDFYDTFHDKIWDIIFKDTEDTGYDDIFRYLYDLRLDINSVEDMKNTLVWYAFETVLDKFVY